MSDLKDPFSIDIALGHPSCDPVSISKMLSLQPTYSWKHGDRVGERVRQATQWYGLVFSGSGVAEFENALEKTVSFLTKRKPFITKFKKEDGEVELVLNHAMGHTKGKAFELRLDPLFLACLSRLGISLRVQVWSDNPSWSLHSR